MDKGHPHISMRRQSKLLGVARSTADYQPVVEDPEDIRIKRLLDEIYLIDPCLGSRRLVTVLKRDHGVKVNRKRLDRLRREMGTKRSGASRARAFRTMDTANTRICCANWP